MAVSILNNSHGLCDRQRVKHLLSVMNYGMFIQNVFDFIIVSFAIFIVIKLINKLHRKKEETTPVAPAPTKEEVLLAEIRDLIKEQNQHQ